MFFSTCYLGPGCLPPYPGRLHMRALRLAGQGLAPHQLLHCTCRWLTLTCSLLKL